MSKKIHVAIGSTTSLPGQIEHNMEQIAEFARRGAMNGVNLLLTPEMSASGYGGYPEVIATAETAGDGPVYQALAKTAGETGVVIAAGFVEEFDSRPLIAHYVVYPDGHYLVQRKHRVTETETPLEPVVPFAPDKDNQQPRQPVEKQFVFFEVKDVRCVVSICADAGITGIGHYFYKNGVELLLGPTGAGGKRENRVTTADLQTEVGREKYLEILETVFSPGQGATNCIKYRRALAAVNMCGYDGMKHYHVGHGMIINPMGEVEGFFHGIPNLDRQRPMYTEAVIDLDIKLRNIFV